MHSTETELKQQVKDSFTRIYGSAPEVTAFAPGRVNLLGEHTDYNGGFVLPMPLGIGVAMAVSRGEAPGTLRLGSTEFASEDVRRIDEQASGAWSDYVLGAFAAIVAREIAETGLRVMIASNLPLGAGLSSSAAVEVCTLRTAAALFGLPADPVDFALKARAVENDFVGLPCGIMDQFAVSVGAPGHALFLDTRTLDHRPAPIPQGHAVVVIHSGVRHRLTDSGYTTRVAECKAACEALGVPLLSDLDTDALPRIDALPVPLNRRARHVITDNRLTKQGLAALEAGNARAFGRLMIESHATERDNYEITVPETDALAEGCLAAGALGARQTGGGFGGSVVALVPEDKIATFCDTIQARFPDTRVLAVS